MTMSDESTSAAIPSDDRMKESLSQEEDSIEALQAKISELESSLNQIKDQFLRKAAEFENYKRRIENELNERIRFANEDLLYELLPIVDDLERSLKSSSNFDNKEVLHKGVELIYQKLLKILLLQGVKPFESIGKQFDAEYHDALLQIPKEDVPPHTVIEEAEKGYMIYDKVLRHAKVIVSSDNDNTTSKQGNEGLQS